MPPRIPNAPPLDQKIGDFYGSCMDESHIEQLGTQPIQPGLDRIAALQSKKDLVPEVASLHLGGSGVLVFLRSLARSRQRQK